MKERATLNSQQAAQRAYEEFMRTESRNRLDLDKNASVYKTIENGDLHKITRKTYTA